MSVSIRRSVVDLKQIKNLIFKRNIERKTGVLQIKKEEISPKISPSELNLYPIQYVIIIVICFSILKKSLGEETISCGVIYYYHYPLDVLKANSLDE